MIRLSYSTSGSGEREVTFREGLVRFGKWKGCEVCLATLPDERIAPYHGEFREEQGSYFVLARHGIWVNGEKINEKTKGFEGMKVPVKILIDPKTKSFEIKVGTPPTSSLLFKELGVEKGSGTPNTSKAGNITIAQAIKIAGMKGDSLMGKDLKMQVLEVIGVCVSSGITVEGKDPKVIQKEIKEGKWDAKLKA